jgi:hypothetical protein
VPRQLAEIVNRAMEKDRARRYQSAGEFAEAIAGYLEGSVKPTEPRVMPIQAATRQAEPYIRCSACSEIIAAKTSITGVCQTCKAPICSKCWSIRRVRYCLQHKEPAGPAKRSVAEVRRSFADLSAASPAVGDRPISLQPTISMVVAPGLPQRQATAPADGPLCPAPAPAVVPNVQPAALVPAVAPPEPAPVKMVPVEQPVIKEAPLQVAEAEEPKPKEPSLEEQSREKMAQARAEGRPVVSAAEARLAEDTFLRLVENCLPSIAPITDPCRGVAIAVKSWSRSAYRRDRALQLRPGDGPEQATLPWLECGPRGAEVVFDLRKRVWWGPPQGRVLIEVRNLAHLERLAAEGYDDRPITRIDLESLLNDTSRRAAVLNTWHVLILHNPTGWTDEAKEFVLGKGPRPFHDRLVSVVLFEQGSSQFLMDETDEKLLPMKEAFSAEMHEATFAKARQFVEEYFELHNSLALETLLRELGISRKAGVRVFKVLSATGAYGLESLEEVGMVLTPKQ